MVLHRIFERQLRAIGDAQPCAHTAHSGTHRHPHRYRLLHTVQCSLFFCCKQKRNSRFRTTRRLASLQECMGRSRRKAPGCLCSALSIGECALRGEAFSACAPDITQLTVTEFEQLFSQGRVNQELGKERVLPFSDFWKSDWPAKAPLAGLALRMFFNNLCVNLQVHVHCIDWVTCHFVIFALPAGDAYNFVVNVVRYTHYFIDIA